MPHLDVELGSVVVAILHEPWDQRDSSRLILDCLMWRAEMLAEEMMGQQQREKRA